MKKFLPALALLAFFAGCGKNIIKPVEPETEQTNGKKYDVTFKVADFKIESAPIKIGASVGTLAASPAATYADYLSYRVYDATGKLLNTINQTATTTNFGTITDQLPAGTYKVFIAASQSPFNFSGSNTLSTDIYTAPSTIWNDTFTSLTTLVVGVANVSTDVTLERSLAGLDITITDAIPSGVARLTFGVSPDPGYINIDGTNNYTGTGGMTSVFPILPTDIGKTNMGFTRFVGSTGKATSVTIRAWNSANAVVAEKIVPNVTFTRNQKIILTGTLFTPKTSGFVVSIDPAWGITKSINF